MASEQVTATDRPTSGDGLKYIQVIGLCVIIVAVAMSCNIAFNHRIGIVADLGLVIATVVVSFRVRSADFVATFWAPAISWFIAVITVGQFATNNGGSWKVQQVFLLVYGLGSHFLWILGTTVLAVVIHYFRGRTA
ncbi:MAG: hypothetical protein NTW81_02755 [Actinobacteria bacterium]|nr:hypothetical protein [Actinomycetota bacterium]